MHARGLGPVVAIVLGGSWAILVALGFAAIEAYERRPGESGAAPASWPRGSGLALDPGRPNVVMAVHPRCPCTRASLAGLATAVRESPAGASVRLLVYRPEGSSPTWPGRSIAGAVIGARVVDDPGGREAERFGLATSGGVAAYDAAGLLRYAGGLTEARGREGPAPGRDAVRAVLRGEPVVAASAAVFGCGLRNVTRGAVP